MEKFSIMARNLTFSIKKKEYEVIPLKVDRKKLYGWTEILALDEHDEPCKLVNTDESGRFIIPKGGTGLGILSRKGEWVDRSTLRTVKENGDPAEVIPSSFTILISLSKKVTVEEYLDYSITDFYELSEAPDAMIRAIGEDIYFFEYSYLDSYEGTPAFIMVSGGVLFMLLGYKNRFDMLCLGDCKQIDEEDDFIEIEDDDIDFSMF